MLPCVAVGAADDRRVRDGIVNQYALTNPFEPVPLRSVIGRREGTGTRFQQRVRRSHVFAAIRRLLTDVGCEDITVRNIAATSGYAVQTVYNLVGPRELAISDAISEYSIAVGRSASCQLEHPMMLPAIVDRWLQAITMTPHFVRQCNMVFFSGSRGIYYRFRDRQLSGLYNLLRRQKACGIIKDDVDIRLLSERLGLFASALCVEWADHPFPLNQLHEQLCSGFAGMLADSLTPENLDAVWNWVASVKGGELPLRPGTQLDANIQ